MAPYDPVHIRNRLWIGATGFAILFAAVAMRLAVVMLTGDGSPVQRDPLSVVASIAAQYGFALANVAAIYWLYRLRCRRLRLYGVLEIVVGMLTAMLVINQLTGSEISRVILLVVAQVGALYVAVRGLDNVHKSLDGEDRAAWERHFFAPRA